MSKKNKFNKPSKPTENPILGDDTSIVPEMITLENISITLTEEHFDSNPTLAMEGLNLGDVIEVDKFDSVEVQTEDETWTLEELSEAASIDNYYTDMIQLMIRRIALGESISIPLEYVVDFNTTTGMFHYFTEESKVASITSGRIHYCQANMNDLEDLEVTKNGVTSIFKSLPTSYDIVKDQGATVAVFSKAGKLDFKDLFNLQMATLKSSL